ncbi:alpha/beta hydrolase, partial [Microbacterium sp. NPDC096154]|uniref:alpha/beta hydrolase n=1 Tax=Microbacterium sp. NPDC096154 TaxID=3155549 RepID=UPI003332205B
TELDKMRSFEPPKLEGSPEVNITIRHFQGLESKLMVKIYEPKNRTTSILPAVYWIHGGGYVLGSPHGDDGFCEYMVKEVHCVVVSIDYRLAPEHPYPAAIEDCYAGLNWTAEHANDLQIDLTRLAIAGASAGGGLTAALALMARDRGGPKITFQIPLYPMLDDRNETPSSYEINEDNMPLAWNRESNIIAWNMYLGTYGADSSNATARTEETSSYAAPSRATDLSNLPPAYTFIGQLDPFRDETIDYVARLAQAGVPVEFHLYPGCFHGFDAIFNEVEISKQARSECMNALKKAFDNK